MPEYYITRILDSYPDSPTQTRQAAGVVRTSTQEILPFKIKQTEKLRDAKLYLRKDSQKQTQ